MRKRERRIRRSHHKGIALNLQLQASAERLGVEAMVLASRDGLVVASSPWNQDATEQVAAHLSEVHAHQFRVSTLRREGGAPCTMAARGFDADDEGLVLCAVGCPTERMVGEMYQAMGGIKRILDS